MTKLTLVNPNRGPQDEEKRAFPRLPWKTDIRGTNGEEFQLQDFSPGGVGLTSKTALKPRQFIELALNSPGGSSQALLACQILWAKKDQNTEEYVAGARFVNEPESDYSLTKYLYNAIKSQIESDLVSVTPIQFLLKESLDWSIVDKIQKLELPTFFKNLVGSSRKFNTRPEYVWKWCYQAMKDTTLSCIDRFHSQSLENTKLLNFLFTFLLDDLADEKKESTLLAECFKMIFFKQGISAKKIPASFRHEAQFLEELWGIIQSNMRQFPKYDEFKDIIQFDIEQTLCSLKYAYLSNTFVDILNEEEAIQYEGNNINIMVNAMLDLMCSPNFNLQELGKLREALFHAQMMCKISNWISTWEREVKVNDWTSGIVATAISRGVISSEELRNSDRPSIVSKIKTSLVQEQLVQYWEKHRRLFIEKSQGIKSIDVPQYLKALEKFIQVETVLKVLQ